MELFFVVIVVPQLLPFFDGILQRCFAGKLQKCSIYMEISRE